MKSPPMCSNLNRLETSAQLPKPKNKKIFIDTEVSGNRLSEYTKNLLFNVGKRKERTPEHDKIISE
jgi:hypothetical protein